MNISDLTPEARRDEWGRMVRAHAREGFAGKRPRPYFSYGPGGHGNEIYDDLVQEDDIELAERELHSGPLSMRPRFLRYGHSVPSLGGNSHEAQ